MLKKLWTNGVWLMWCVVLLSAIGVVNCLPLAGAQGVDSYTKLMLHADGSDQGTSFTDSETTPKTVTNTESYDSYTKLMLHMENNATDSAAGKTVTNNNATFSSSVYKMGGYSGVFNGSNAYLSLADSDDWDFGSGDFTIDFWVRFNTLPAEGVYYPLFGNYGGADSGYNSYYEQLSGVYSFQFTDGNTDVYWNYALSINTWYHIAIVRNGGNLDLYVGGSKQTTNSAFNIGTSSNPLFVGSSSPNHDRWIDGWIDELRISKGIARWTSNFTPPSSPYGKVYTVTGTKKFGTASGEFKGSGEYLSLVDSDDWNFGAGDFTIDFWARWNVLPAVSGAQMLVSQLLGNNYYQVYLYNNAGTYKLYWSVISSDIILINKAETATVAINTWYHVAVTRSGSNTRIFLDGTQLGSTDTTSYTVPDVASVLYIGNRVDAYFLNGYLDELRITKGIARWTSNFTPPSAPYEVDTTPPTVTSTSPASSATGVGISSAISATFSEDMDSSTITTSTFTLSSVSGTVSYSNKTATFTPSSNLSYSTTYTATVTTGVKDSGGNAMSSTYTWSFTTSTATATPTPTPSPGDTTAPTVTITSPTSSATYTTTSSTITLSGTASENSGSVSSVTWSNSKGGSGTASGTTNWTISGISLSSGDNVITVTATDGSGNFGTDTITVTYNVTSTPTPTAVPTATTTPTPTPTAQPTPTRPPTLPPLPTPQPSPSPATNGIVFGFVNDEDEQPLEGVTVAIVGANGRSPLQNSTETDENGYYEFRGLDAGEYAITYEKEGFLAQTIDISLEEGELKDLGVVILEQIERGRLYGYAVNIKGDPIEFVRLKLRGIKTKVTRSAASDADGFFEFTDLDADTYVIIAKKKGFRKNQQKVKLEEGESEEIEIVMKKTSKRIKELLLEEDVQ